MVILESEKHWLDSDGTKRRVPQIKGRLKMSCPTHKKLREFVIRRDGGKCKKCSSAECLVADHIISRRNGGSHHPNNLQCLCTPCNAAKASTVDRRFRAVLNA